MATIISIAGVLVAGSAAALVNAQALGGTASQASSLPDLRSATSTSAAAAASSTSAFEEPQDENTHVLSIAEGGSVTVSSADGALGIVAVEPAAGWQVATASSVSATEIAVIFVSPARQLNATIRLSDGTIVATIDRLPNPAAAASLPTQVQPADVSTTTKSPAFPSTPTTVTGVNQPSPTGPSPTSPGPTPTSSPAAPSTTPTTPPSTVITIDDDSPDDTHGTEPDDDVIGGGGDDD